MEFITPSCGVADCRVCAAVCGFTREVADRILGVREHISKELLEELALIPDANTDIKRRWGHAILLVVGYQQHRLVLLEAHNDSSMHYTAAARAGFAMRCRG